MNDEELEGQFSGPDDGGGGDEPEPAASPPPPSIEETPTGPRLIQVGTLNVPEDELVSLVEFQNWARGNPDKMEAFGRYLRGEAQFVVPDAPKEPTIDWDMVDPNVKNAYDEQQHRLEELQQRMQQMEAPISAIQEHQMVQVRQEAQTAIDAATGKIMERFKLSDDEIDQLADAAAKLNIVPSLRAQGMAPQAALETALETAFWQDERWRSKVVDEEIAARGAGDRRSRASQVGGTSGSSGRAVDSQPVDEAGRRAAMASEIAEALRGTP